VLGAEVEERERIRRVLGDVELEQGQVPLRLPARRDALRAVAVVVDVDVDHLEALGQVERHGARLLLVDAADEAVLGPVAEEAHGLVDEAAARVFLAEDARHPEVEPLAPGAGRQLAQQRRLSLVEVLVGVQVENPVARRMVEGDVARVRERAVQGCRRRRAERAGDLDLV
jgi:hypothetical protein